MAFSSPTIRLFKFTQMYLTSSSLSFTKYHQLCSINYQLCIHLLNFAGLRLNFARSHLNFAVSQLNFARSRLNFAGSHLNFAVAQLNFAGSWLNFARSMLNFAGSQPNFARSQLNFAVAPLCIEFNDKLPNKIK